MKRKSVVAKHPHRPASVVWALRLLWMSVWVAAAAVVLTVIFSDDLVLTWAAGNPEAKQLVDQGGLAALEASSIEIPGFVPLALTLFTVFAGLTWMLGIFFAGGHAWARWSLVVLAVFGVFVSGVAITLGLPLGFVVLCVLGGAICLGLLVLMLRRETGRYLTLP